jgi:hypothetical protein
MKKRNKKFGPEEIWKKEWATVRKALEKMEIRNPSLSYRENSFPFPFLKYYNLGGYYKIGCDFKTNQSVYVPQDSFSKEEEKIESNKFFKLFKKTLEKGYIKSSPKTKMYISNGPYFINNRPKNHNIYKLNKTNQNKENDRTR